MIKDTTNQKNWCVSNWRHAGMNEACVDFDKNVV